MKYPTYRFHYKPGLRRVNEFMNYCVAKFHDWRYSFKYRPAWGNGYNLLFAVIAEIQPIRGSKTGLDPLIIRIIRISTPLVKVVIKA